MINNGRGIVAESITKYYGDQHVLKGVSLEVSPGRILGLLGPNGAGKSTTLRILAGGLVPDAGHVEVFGTRLDPANVGLRNRIGFLPEHNPLYPDLYVTEFLSFVGRLHRLRFLDQRIRDVIDLTGLGPERHKQIRQLSKGYRQRVGLAQAIIHDPDVLILDEPTSGLDPNQLVGIRSLLRNLGKEKAILLSTHILHEVQTICDDVLIIHQGEVAAQVALDGQGIQNGATGLEELFVRLTKT